MAIIKRRSRWSSKPTGSKTHPTANDVTILQAINRHGALPTPHIHAFHSTTNYPYTQKRLKELVHEKHPSIGAPVIYRPKAQLRTSNPLAHYAVHEISPVGQRWMKGEGLWQNTIPVTGDYEHKLMISTTTASIEIAAIEKDIEFIPGHIFLDRAKSKLEYKVGERKLIPDQFFVLKYPDGSYRAFVVECDRGTEQIEDTPRSLRNKRKTLETMFTQYQQFIGKSQYKDHYGIKSGLLVLNVMSSEARMDHFIDIMPDCKYMLFQTVEGFETPVKPPNVNRDLLNKPWTRSGEEPLDISE